jgi:hypothetical protein
MKTLIFSYLFFLITGLTISGQEIPCQNPSPGFEKFLGTWQWVSANDTFTFRLIKDTGYFKPRDTVFILLTGWHRFIANDTVLESSLEFSDSVKNKFTTLVGSRIEKNILSLVFKDITRDRSFNVEMELLNEKGDRAIWTSYFIERIRVNEPPPKIREGQTVPSNIVLFKIKDNLYKYEKNKNNIGQKPD